MRYALALLLLASPLAAQDKLFNGLDGWRERQRWLPASLDNTDAKTWFWHGVITEAGGYALSKVTPLSFRRSRQVVALFYVARELHNLRSTHSKTDAVMDALVPIAVATLNVRFEVRF